jgi:uncharacterized membrane protein YbhN (UPF0104 family)
MHIPQWAWITIKWLLVLAIVVGVSWHFVHLLGMVDFRNQPLEIRPGWLVISALLYLLGLSCSALFWWRLLRSLGERPGLAATLRAYFVGQVGRYLPGKVATVALRASLLHQVGVRVSVASLTIVYEALTTNLAGALLGIVLIVLLGTASGKEWRLLVLLPIFGIPLVPGLFNWLIGRLRRGREGANEPMPRLRARTLLTGLALGCCGWWLQGAGVWAGIAAVAPQPLPASIEAWAKCTAFYAVAQVVAFSMFVVPGGLGVREFLLQQLLTPLLAPALGAGEAAATAIVAVVLLRLAWTVADVLAAAIGYAIPIAASATGDRGRWPSPIGSLKCASSANTPPRSSSSR